MSAITGLIEGLALVLVLVSIYLHFWGIKVLKKYDIAGTNFKRISEDLDVMIQIYKPSLESWKGMIDKNLEIPISEHLFHAGFNTLVTLGASDMGKEGQAKQNMAIMGFQKIGRAIGKGLKKEIPQIEQFGGLVGGSGGADSGMGGLLEIGAEMFGMKLPPGAGKLLGNMAGGGGKAVPAPEEPKTGFV